VLGRFTDQELMRLILRGRPGTPMRATPARSTQGKSRVLVAFLRVIPLAERQRYETSPAAATFSAVRRQLDSAVALRSDKIAFDAYLTFERVETEVRARNAALAGELEDAFASLRARRERVREATSSKRFMPGCWRDWSAPSGWSPTGARARTS